MPASLALLTRAPVATTALVFVHDLGGSAVGTWETFPRELRVLPEASTADAFFVEYQSATQSIAFCAAKFREFLTAVLRTPIPDIVQPSLRAAGAVYRAPERRYDHVVIVAHSMGAVVARRALLDLAELGLAPVERAKIRMLLFAPAHRGSDVLAGLIESSFGLDWLPFGSLVGTVLTTYFRSLPDLVTNSPSLTKLADDSKTARGACRALSIADDHLRAYVCHAEDDGLVDQNDFDADKPFTAIMQRTHRNVCKPDAAFRVPVDQLRSLL